MNFEREDKLSLREINEIISDIHMLVVDVENIFLKDQIEESYAEQKYEGDKEFHQGSKLIKMFDDNINERECIDLIHDFKVSFHNVINHINLTFMNEPNYV